MVRACSRLRLAAVSSPLPERIRPTSLEEVAGQPHLVGPDGVLTRFVAAKHLPSLLLWGPPGCGKTTLARLLANHLGMRFVPFSAVLGGVGELRKLIDEAETVRDIAGTTLLFIDEIHRFNKAQQDALLPHVESGNITLVGATTENPSFSVNRALLSRCRVYPLRALDEDALRGLIARARDHRDGLPGLVVDDGALDPLLRLSAGDGRRLLVLLEGAWALTRPSPVTAEVVGRIASNPVADHDRAGDAHYDVASAFIKSLRASDAQAALYYLARQLEAGEDAMFVARRLVIFAGEDVGLADPQALQLATAALMATERIGMPEAIYPLTEATVYLATAPKSNRVYAAMGEVMEAARETPAAPVPLHIRNAPTRLMKDIGYGRDYAYAFDAEDHYVAQEYLPEELAGRRFYEPSDFGFEKRIAERLAWWRERKAEAESQRSSSEGES